MSEPQNATTTTPNRAIHTSSGNSSLDGRTSSDVRTKVPACPGRRVHLPNTNITFELGPQLGSGAAAVVFKAYKIYGANQDVSRSSKPPDGSSISDENLQREVFDPHEYAAKVMDLRGLRLRNDYEGERAKIRREVAILSELHHPCIVNLLHVIETADELFLIMELVKGGELFYKIIERKSLTEDQARYVLMQVLAALQYMHRKNVIHRDLKPENILISAEVDDGFYRVQVADFGLAKLVRPGYSQPKTLVGTPQYWAPEVVAAQTKPNQPYGPEVDLWSLGVVIYVMLAGAYPFDDRLGPIAPQIQEARYHFRYERFRGVSEAAKDVIRGLLTRDPKSRMTLEGLMDTPWVRDYTPPPRVQALPELCALPSRDHRPTVHAWSVLTTPSMAFLPSVGWEKQRQDDYPMEDRNGHRLLAIGPDGKVRMSRGRGNSMMLDDFEGSYAAVPSRINQSNNHHQQQSVSNPSSSSTSQFDDRGDGSTRLRNYDSPFDPNTRAIVRRQPDTIDTLLHRRPIDPTEMYYGGPHFQAESEIYQYPPVDGDRADHSSRAYGTGLPYSQQARRLPPPYAGRLRTPDGYPPTGVRGAPGLFSEDAIHGDYLYSGSHGVGHYAHRQYAPFDPQQHGPPYGAPHPDSSRHFSAFRSPPYGYYSGRGFHTPSDDPLVGPAIPAGRLRLPSDQFALLDPRGAYGAGPISSTATSGLLGGVDDPALRAAQLANIEELLRLQVTVMRRLHSAYLAFRQPPEAMKRIKDAVIECQELQHQASQATSEVERASAEAVFKVAPEVTTSLMSGEKVTSNELRRFEEDVITWISQLQLQIRGMEIKLAEFSGQVNRLMEIIKSVRGAPVLPSSVGPLAPPTLLVTTPSASSLSGLSVSQSDDGHEAPSSPAAAAISDDRRADSTVAAPASLKTPTRSF